MKKSAKLLSMALAASMVLSMAACSGGSGDDKAPAETTTAAGTDATTAAEAEKDAED